MTTDKQGLFAFFFLTAPHPDQGRKVRLEGRVKQTKPGEDVWNTDWPHKNKERPWGRS